MGPGCPVLAECGFDSIRGIFSSLLTKERWHFVSSRALSNSCQFNTSSVKRGESSHELYLSSRSLIAIRDQLTLLLCFAIFILHQKKKQNPKPKRNLSFHLLYETFGCFEAPASGGADHQKQEPAVNASISSQIGLDSV